MVGLAAQLTSACWGLEVTKRDLTAPPPRPLRSEASRGCLLFPGTPAALAARACAVSSSASATSRTEAAYPARHQSAAVICPIRCLAEGSRALEILRFWQ